jgi:signal peptidase I
MSGREKRPRLFLAAFLSLMTAGLGQMAIGHWRRGAFWYAVVLSLAVGMVVTSALTLPRAMWALFALAVTAQIAAVVDTFRLSRPAVLPGAGAILLILLGFGVYYEILAGHARRLVVESFRMPSPSMYPTIDPRDHFFVNKRPGQYRRGDVVLFKYPLDPEITYAKRIVAIGGDTLEIRAGQLVVNGTSVDRAQTGEPCRPAPLAAACTVWRERLDGREYRVITDDDGRALDFEARTVPPGNVFVMGDNRDNSNDSRVWGPVKAELLLGRMTWIWWSSGPEGIRWERMNQEIR